MHYDCDGTGTKAKFIAPVLALNFGYHATFYHHYHYNAVKASLDNAHPIILSGGHKTHFLGFPTYSDGHVWVCDGYRVIRECAPGSEPGFVHYRYLHMNWGWGGSEGDENGGTYGYSFNGWYKGGFNPGNDDYNYQNHMIVNIHPQN